MLDEHGRVKIVGALSSPTRLMSLRPTQVSRTPPQTLDSLNSNRASRSEARRAGASCGWRRS